MGKVSLKRENIDNFKKMFLRFFELYPNPEVSKKVFSGWVTISYAIQDLDHLYERYLQQSIDTDAFYHIMVKVDIIRETYKGIAKLFDFKEEQLYGERCTETRDIIDFFVAIRSITLAHPQSTNRHARFGFDGSIWLEDVRKASNSMLSLYNNDSLNDADFILFLAQAKDNSDIEPPKDKKQGINLEKNVFSVIKVIENSVIHLNNYLKERIDERELSLKNTPIIITDSLNSDDFETLYFETKKRYPSLIEQRNGQQNNYWDLYEVQELLNFITRYYPAEEFKKQLKHIVRKYHTQLQEMQFIKFDDYGVEINDSRDEIKKMMCPSLDILEIKTGQDLHYGESKIYSYLPDSYSSSIQDVLLKKEIYTYEWLAGVKGSGVGMNSSNSEWGIYQLVSIVEMIPDLGFQYISNDQFFFSDKQLYFQFIIQVFNYNKKHKNDLDVIEALKE